MTSYLDKHFKPVPVCCGYFKRHTSKHLPNNKQVKWRAVRISIQNVQYVTVRIPPCRCLEGFMMFLTASLNGDLRRQKRSSKLHKYDPLCTVQSNLGSISRFLTCAPSGHLQRFMVSQFSPSTATVRDFKMHFRTHPSKGKLIRMLPLTYQWRGRGSGDLLTSASMLFKLSMEAVHNISYKLVEPIFQINNKNWSTITFTI